MRPKLYRVAYAWCHDAYLATDIVGETLTTARRGVWQLKEVDSFEAWMFGIFRNCWRNAFRVRHLTADIEAPLDHRSGEALTQDVYFTKGLGARVRKVVAELPLGQRQVITLIDLEEFSYDEAANILAVPVATVMRRMSTARQTLRARLYGPTLRIVAPDTGWGRK